MNELRPTNFPSRPTTLFTRTHKNTARTLPRPKASCIYKNNFIPPAQIRQHTLDKQLTQKRELGIFVPPLQSSLSSCHVCRNEHEAASASSQTMPRPLQTRRWMHHPLPALSPSLNQAGSAHFSPPSLRLWAVGIPSFAFSRGLAGQSTSHGTGKQVTS
jgi:hypothetical protein